MAQEFSALVPGCLREGAPDSPRAGAPARSAKGQSVQALLPPHTLVSYPCRPAVTGECAPPLNTSPGQLVTGEAPCTQHSQGDEKSILASGAGEARKNEQILSSAQESPALASEKNQVSVFTVSKLVTSKGKSTLGRVMFSTAVEPTMLAYMEEQCLDGKSVSQRMWYTLLWFLALLLALPTISFFPFLLPLRAPEDGFLANWVFNLVAHPLLNYVTGRGQLELLSRTFEASERREIRWIVNWAPLASPCVCLTSYMIANVCGVFPLPYAVLTGCIPGIVASICAARCLIPEELLTRDVRRFMMFNFVCWLTWGMQFVVLMLWLVFFPVLPEFWQLMASIAVHSILATSGWAMQKLAGWMELPEYLTTELKVVILFEAFLFTAAQVSQAKSNLVLFAMLVQDAGKSIGVGLQMYQYLVWQYQVDEDGGEESEESGCRPRHALRRSCHALRRSCHALCRPCHALRSLQGFWREQCYYATAVKVKLQEILRKPSHMTKAALREHEISLLDARLLDHFARFIALFTMVEVCEVLVPVVYICVLTLLHSDPFQQNRRHFFVFGDEVQFSDGLRGNAYALLIEGSVLLAIQLALLRALGFNLVHFAGIILRMDFAYWIFALGGCWVAWATVLISHSGHNLEGLQAFFFG